MSLDIDLICKCCGTSVLSKNITNNLSAMATAADIYYLLWDPEKTGIKKASEMIKPLKVAIRDMITRPDHYKQYEPENKWGTYDGFIHWLKVLFKTCVKYPDTIYEIYK